MFYSYILAMLISVEPTMFVFVHEYKTDEQCQEARSQIKYNKQFVCIEVAKQKI